MAETATTRMEQVAAEDEALAKRDKEFKREWLELQKATYPQFARTYQRQLDHLDDEEKVEKRAATPVYFANGSTIAGAEPGHDPTIQALNEEGAKDRDDSRQGMDNRPPSETVREQAIAQPAPAEEEADGDEKKAKRAAAEK